MGFVEQRLGPAAMMGGLLLQVLMPGPRLFMGQTGVIDGILRAFLVGAVLILPVGMLLIPVLVRVPFSCSAKPSIYGSSGCSARSATACARPGSIPLSPAVIGFVLGPLLPDDCPDDTRHPYTVSTPSGPSSLGWREVWKLAYLRQGQLQAPIAREVHEPKATSAGDQPCRQWRNPVSAPHPGGHGCHVGRPLDPNLQQLQPRSVALGDERYSGQAQKARGVGGVVESFDEGRLHEIEIRLSSLGFVMPMVVRFVWRLPLGRSAARRIVTDIRHQKLTGLSMIALWVPSLLCSTSDPSTSTTTRRPNRAVMSEVS